MAAARKHHAQAWQPPQNTMRNEDECRKENAETNQAEPLVVDTLQQQQHLQAQAKSAKVPQAMRPPFGGKKLLEQFQRTVTTGGGIDPLERQTSEAETEADDAHATIDSRNFEKSYQAAE